MLIFATQTEAYPMFTQDELSLIRAEALARLNRLPEALLAVNEVRERAGLAPRTAVQLATQPAMLNEIFNQRRYSLFASGLAWSDLRRFGRESEAE